MEIVVEVKNEILGDGIFWRGPVEHIGEIRNIPARETAKLVARDGKKRVCGMWHVSAVETEKENMKASEILQDDDLAWLIRFRETAEDDNSYDTPKDALRRLIELGVVRSLGFGRCATTAFGDWLIEQHFEQTPKLPLKTEADHWKTPNA